MKNAVKAVKPRAVKAVKPHPARMVGAIKKPTHEGGAIKKPHSVKKS